MKRFVFKNALLSVCLVISPWICVNAYVSGSEKLPQPGFYPVVVNGRVLSGTNSLARSSSDRIFVPISSIAAALGDNVEVNPVSRLVTVRRSKGIAIFDARSGQVSEGGALILTISNPSETMYGMHVYEMLLSMEIAAVLFDASIQLDTAKNTVIVSRGVTGVGIVTEEKIHKSFEIYQVDYEYRLNRYTGQAASDLILTAAGRLFDGRFFVKSDSSSSLRRFAPRNFSINLERPNGQRFVLGDVGTGSALSLLMANVRGGLATLPYGRFTVSAFGGRADSGTVLPIVFRDDPDLIAFTPKPRFDTSVLGGYVTTKFISTILTAGTMRFAGPSRSGSVASSSAAYSGYRLRIQADTGIGTFEGRDTDNRPVAGTGTAYDVAGTYQFADNLSFHGRITQISKDFLSPQSGVRDPVDLKAAGVSWSPTRWLSTTFNASTTRRPGRSNSSDRYLSTAFGISPGAGRPRFFISHTQNNSDIVPKGAFTSVNASQDYRRWRFFATASRIKMNGPANANLTAGANVVLNERNSLEISQGIGLGSRVSGTIDWRASGLFRGRMSLSAGGGYTRSPGVAISVFERLNASLRLPKRSSIQFTYMHNTNAGSTVLIQLRGSIFRKREAGALLNSPIAEAKKFGTVSGRVYQDVDGDGRYEAGTDKPQSGVKVRVDGNRYVESDINGVYRFDAIDAGVHRLYLDLLSVRADLTILDGAALELSISGGQTTSFDFRLVRTGRASGRVWFDENSNGTFDQGEQPIADVRIVTSGGRDTLTDQDGFFTIADLTPGEQVFLIDEKTLPDNIIPTTRSLSVQISPGRETRDVSMPVISIPAEVRRFPPRNQPQK